MHWPKGPKARLSNHLHSDEPIGEKDRVIGHTAVGGPVSGPANLTASEKVFLLELARWSLQISASGQGLPEPGPANVPPKLAEHRACFVTLTCAGKLRGCIGQLSAKEPLYHAVIHNTRNAATRDPRFPPVESREVDSCRIEISVLTDPQPLHFTSPEDLLTKLHPGEDGVILRIGGCLATFLPQVWAHVPGKMEFLDLLARKAGCDSNAWRGPDVSISIYHVESFGEEP